MQAITITLNGIEVSGTQGMTILDLAQESGVEIPTLCHHAHLNPYGACRICLVEDERSGALLASCVSPIASGMIINTHSEKVLDSRKAIVRLMLASHPDTCMVCDKGNRCDLRRIATDLGVGWIDLQRLPHSAQIQDLNPFIERDLSKCIMCAKCIRADQERVVIGAIDYFNRGFTSKPATLGDQSLEHSDCTFCGTCVAVCPTGAIAEKIRPYGGTTTQIISTVCSFCSCGCNIKLEVSHNQVIRTRPNETHSPNGITLCARGSYGYDYIHSPDRLTQPLLKIDGEFQTISWEEAFKTAAERLEQIRQSHGPESIAVFGSSKCTNEENYLLQKFARQIIGTPHIDNGGSLHYRTARATLAQSLGWPAVTNPLADIEKSEAILLLTGSDIEVIAPLVSYAIKRAVKHRKAKLVVIDPCQSGINAFAGVRIHPKAGTRQTLLKGMMKVIIDEGLYERHALSDQFELLEHSLDDFMPAYVAELTGVTEKDIEQAALIFGQANGAAIICATDHDIPELVNLSLLTSNLGKVGGGIYPLQRENNAQGAGDMGCLPDFLPGYQPIEGNPGLSIVEMMTQAKAGQIKGMVIMGENPAAGFPDPQTAQDALSTVDFLMVQDMFLTETAQMADLVLPVASFAEKDGTFTNLERRVQRLRKAIDPPGEALPDWHIIQQLAEAMGFPMNYSSPDAIMEEIATNVPLYQGITYESLQSGGRYWPTSPTRRFGTSRLYQNGFPDALGDFVTTPPDEKAIQDSQVRLTIPTMPNVFHFGSGARTSRSRRLNAMSFQNV